jgi:enterochelin esterase-like enzyme
VNSRFATLVGPLDTFAMGSSLGGLASFLAVHRRSDVFSAAACLSPAFQVDVIADVALQVRKRK